jgi:hypothetical protein
MQGGEQEQDFREGPQQRSQHCSHLRPLRLGVDKHSCEDLTAECHWGVHVMEQGQEQHSKQVRYVVLIASAALAAFRPEAAN